MSTADVRGRFIWHELLTTDTAAAAAFYPRVVPWRNQPSSMPGYTLWMAGQTQIGGLTALPQEAGGPPPHWLIYVGTPSVDASCLQAQSLGARVLKAPADIPNVGRFAVLSDPQGATFALFTPGSGPPPGPEPLQGGFSWHELATTDVAGAARFYGELFGWRKGRAHDMGAMGTYQIFEHAGNQAGGMCNVQGPSIPPSWLSYVHVADSNRAVAAAKATGGRLMHGPIEVPGGSWIALMMDPQGGAFAVQEGRRRKSARGAGAASTPRRSVPANALRAQRVAASARWPAVASSDPHQGPAEIPVLHREQQVRRCIGESLDDVLLGGNAARPVPGNRVAQKFAAPMLVVARPDTQRPHLRVAGQIAPAGEDRLRILGLYRVLHDAPARCQVPPGDDGVEQLPAGIVEVNIHAARGESFQPRAHVLRRVVDAGRQPGVARHPVASFPVACDADGPRALQHRDLSGHGAGRIGCGGHQHGLSRAQLREVQQAEVGGHARGSQHPQRTRGGCLPGMQQAGMPAVRDTQLLQAALEHHQAPDAEHLVARLDHLAHAVRRYQIPGFHRVVRRGVGRAHERVERQPQCAGEERAVGEGRPGCLDQLQVARLRRRPPDPDLEVVREHPIVRPLRRRAAARWPSGNWHRSAASRALRSAAPQLPAAPRMQLPLSLPRRCRRVHNRPGNPPGRAVLSSVPYACRPPGPWEVSRIYAPGPPAQGPLRSWHYAAHAAGNPH